MLGVTYALPIDSENADIQGENLHVILWNSGHFYLTK